MPELKSLLMLLVITAFGAGVTLYLKNQIIIAPVVNDAGLQINNNQDSPASSTVEVTPPAVTPTIKVKPDNTPANPPMGIIPSFTGPITAVNTGCFADGECSVTVGSEKVILLVGWYQGPVGKIIGADSIGDLENYIGSNATVFAGKNEVGDYTLLGNETFYIQVSSTTKPITSSCVVGGCSSQLCGEAQEMEGMVTTCEYKEEYACYKKTTCERQATGKCGWTENDALKMCLAQDV